MFDFTSRQDTFNFDTNKKIVVIGAGGIGWSLVKYLVMAGINDITVFDHDTIESHNLSRLDAPLSFLSANKAVTLGKFVKQMRPDCNILAIPYKFNPDIVDLSAVDIIVDCSDKFESQQKVQSIAKKNGVRYMKVGYNGTHITISNNVPEWDATPGGTQDGYTIIPSFISPASIVASLAVYNILSSNYREVSCDINDFYMMK